MHYTWKNLFHLIINFMAAEISSVEQTLRAGMALIMQ